MFFIVCSADDPEVAPYGSHMAPYGSFGGRGSKQESQGSLSLDAPQPQSGLTRCEVMGKSTSQQTESLGSGHGLVFWGNF